MQGVQIWIKKWEVSGNYGCYITAFSTRLTPQLQFYTSLSILLHTGKGTFPLTVHEVFKLFTVKQKSD